MFCGSRRTQCEGRHRSNRLRWPGMWMTPRTAPIPALNLFFQKRRVAVCQPLQTAELIGCPRQIDASRGDELHGHVSSRAAGALPGAIDRVAGGSAGEREVDVGRDCVIEHLITRMILASEHAAFFGDIELNVFGRILGLAAGRCRAVSLTENPETGKLRGIRGGLL